MPRATSVLAVAMGLLLSLLAGSPASARIVQNPRTFSEESLRVIGNHGAYSDYWTNSANDTLLIRASIDYDTATEKGRLNIIVACYVGDPIDQRPNRCKLKGGTKVWENFTTGGHISGTIPEQDNGLSAYSILGTWRSMVDTNSYNSRGRDIWLYATKRGERPRSLAVW